MSTMSIDDRPKVKGRALLFGVLGALLGAGIYFSFMALWGVQFGLVAILGGILAGYSARWLGKARSTSEGLIVGLMAASGAFIADVAFYLTYLVEDPEMSLLGLLLHPWTILFYALNLVGALLIVLGFEPVSVLMFQPEHGGSPVSPSTPFQGVTECPTCGSLQTEAQELDMETDQPTLMNCNACGHRWTPGARV